MNSTLSDNQTSSLVVTCKDSYAGISVQLYVIALDYIVQLPVQIWVLWLGISKIRKTGRLAASDILTMNLSALECLGTILYSSTIAAFAFKSQETVLFTAFFSGCYLVGRPFMNSLICVERYIAVAYPVIYRNQATVKHRYIGAGLVWLGTLSYGGLAVSLCTQYTRDIYILSLAISLLVITACSLGVLKVLLRPSPGETQKEGMPRQKKRAFVIITVILVCISVPYGLDLLLFSIKDTITINAFCVLQSIIMWLSHQCSVIPLLYLSKHGTFSCITTVLIKTTLNVEATSS